MSVIKKRIRIGGMSCVGCQNKIQRELKRAAGVRKAVVNYNTGTADVAFDPDLIGAEEIIGRAGYRVLKEEKKETISTGQKVGILAIIAVLYFFLQKFGILNLLVPGQLADTKMGYGMLFLVGAMTSVHCIAMCGGIHLSQCLPVMMSFGSLASFLSRKFRRKATVIGAVLIVVMGLAMVSQGVNLSGIRSDLGGVGTSVNVPEESGDVEIVDGVQVVRTTLEPGRYPDICVQAGMLVKWIIEAPEGSVNGCNYRMVLRDYGVMYEFKEGENVIEFMPQEEGTVLYTCWMGMIRGHIYIVDER